MCCGVGEGKVEAGSQGSRREGREAGSWRKRRSRSTVRRGKGEEGRMWERREDWEGEERLHPPRRSTRRGGGESEGSGAAKRAKSTCGRWEAGKVGGGGLEDE
jgi:hypothetical protein